MKKRLLSLLFMLALCLGLLPVTALAAEGAPNTLYVGNQQVIKSSSTTYWTTDNSGGLTLVDDATDANDWTVRYNPNTATLTLKDATIETTHTQSGAVIYAESAVDSAVSLTINLEGTNKIECNTASYGIYVNAEMASDSYGTDASLTITGTGSLAVSGSTHGIWVKSGSGNASLTINSASVEANTSTDPYSAGVNVQSSTNASVSPNLSLAVNGGSLTASGGTSSDGIQFYVSNPDATNAITSLTVTGNAIVDAKNGGISALRILVPLPTPTPTGENSSGIVFDGTEGTVYGNVTLDESLTINQGETLTIPQGSSLTSNDKLTNNGTVTIENGGTLTDADKVTNNGTIIVKDGGTLNGEPGGTGKIETTPTIDTQPASQTVTVGQTATFTVSATGENLTYQWQYSSDNGTNWNDISGATINSYTTDAATLAMNGYQYQCVVSNSAGSAESNDATLTVTQPVTGVKLNTDNLSLVEGGAATLTATVAPENATNDTVTWASSNTAIATVDTTGKVTAVAPGTATITATAADGSGQAATCKVTVNAKTYSLSIDPGAIGFGTAAVGYTQPAVREVTVKNTGNQTLTLTHPTAVNFELGKLNQLTLAPGEKAIFTVRPKAGLPRGNYSETVLVAAGSCQASINLTFTVQDGTTAAPVTESRTLHFNTMGGLPMDDVKFGLGAPVELWPYTPVRAGYLFQGWYADEALTQPVGTIVLVKDTTLYAKWAPDPAAQAAAGSGSGSSGSGSGGSGSGSKATPTPSPSPTPQPTATPTPTPAPTATPEPTPEVTPAPEETDKGGFPILPVAAGVVVLAALAGGILWFRRR